MVTNDHHLCFLNQNFDLKYIDIMHGWGSCNWTRPAPQVNFFSNALAGATTVVIINRMSYIDTFKKCLLQFHLFMQILNIICYDIIINYGFRFLQAR